ANAVSGNGRLHPLGKTNGGRAGARWWNSNLPALAHPTSTSAQALLATPDSVSRGDSKPHPSRLGYFLQFEGSVVPVPVHKVAARPSCLCPDLQNLQADVRRYRNRHRQRPSLPICAVGPLVGKALSAVVCRFPHAAP